MAPVILHEKNKTALGELGLWWCQNFGAGYCGDLSVFTLCLVDNGGFHPKQAQHALYDKKNRGRVMELLQRGRERMAHHVRSLPPHTFFTDDPVEEEETNLPDVNTWAQKIADGQSLDVRGVLLAAEQCGTDVQVIQQMVEGNTYMLRDVDGFSTPLRENGRILWTSGCHFEAVVTKVKRGVFACLSAEINVNKSTFTRLSRQHQCS